MSKTRFVDQLPDLINESDYMSPQGHRKIKVQITSGPDGVHILGDSMDAPQLEALLANLEPHEIERMLCG